LNSAIIRMATLTTGGRITSEIVEEEIERLRKQWLSSEISADNDLVTEVLGPERAATLDRFDRVQLSDVLQVCRRCRSLSDAGRELFSISRQRKSNINDADRLRKYLARFNLEWSALQSMNTFHG